MIKWVRFRNFKALREFEADLAPFRVFVGANASGKTSVLQGIRVAAESGNLMPMDLLKDYGAKTEFRSWRATGDIEFELVGQWGANEGIITYTLPTSPDAKGPSAILYNEYREDNQTHSFDAWNSEPRWPSQNLRNVLPNVRFLQFNARSVALPGVGTPDVQIAPSGEGVTNQLAKLRVTNAPVFDEIEAALCRVIPSVQKLTLEEKKNSYQVVFRMHGSSVPAQNASEGTLMALALLTEISEARAQLLLIDEIDRALHPEAQRNLVAEIRKFLCDRPGLQIVATSHSTSLLRCLTTNESRLIAHGADGAEAWASSADNPNYDAWERGMDLKDGWRRVSRSSVVS